MAPCFNPPIARATARTALQGATRYVAVDSNGSDKADALLVAPAHLRAEHARRHQARIARWHQTSEGQRVPACHDNARSRIRPEAQQGDDIIGHKDADDVALVGLGDLMGVKSIVDGLLACRVPAHTNHRLATAVAEIECPRAALVSVAHHRHGLRAQGSQVGVVLVVDRRHGSHHVASDRWARLLSQVLRDGAEREPSIWSQPLGHHVEAEEPVVGTVEGLGTVTPNSPSEVTGDELLDLLGWKPALDLPRTPRGNTTGPMTRDLRAIPSRDAPKTRS